MKYTSRFLISAMLLVMATMPLAAQLVTGKIVGIVRDPSAAAVPGAQVSITNLATGIKREAVTNEVGQYVIPNLPAGEYRIEVTQPGFRPAVVEKVELQVLQTVTADIHLVLGQITEQAVVTASPSLLDTQTSDLGRVVNPKEIDSLPLDGRNYLQLATLTPGVNTFLSNSGYTLLRTSTQFQGSAFQAGTQNVGTTITVGIQRESATTYRMDGISITNPLAAQSSLIPSLENIQEFKVVTGVAPASIHSPASVNVMTKSGANDFHGSMYEFFRNDVLNARSYFDVTKPKVRMNQFGASFGGPIIKRKTFFFGNYEGFRGRTPATAFALLPTAAEMKGDFSQSAAPPVDPTTGLPFPENKIPSQRISQFAKVFNEFIPKPNFVGVGPLSGINYQTQLRPEYNNDLFSVRVDHSFSSKDTIFGRITDSSTTNYSPGLGSLWGFKYPYDAQNLAIGYTHAFGPTLVNQLVGGYTHSVLSQTQEGAGGRNLVKEMGLKNISGGGDDPDQYGLPTAAVIGYQGFGPSPFFVPRGGTQNFIEIQDNLTYVRGRHTLQTGINLSYQGYDSVNPTAPRSLSVYIPGLPAFLGFSGNAVADFLLGLPLVALGDSGDSRQNIHQKFYEFYGQDDWRVTDKLTLNIGLRYSYFTPPADVNNNQGYFDANAGRILSVKAGDTHPGVFNTPKTDFTPRFGIAWSPFGNKTVIRAGYGMYFFPQIMTENLFMRNNPPNYTLYSITNIPAQPITNFFPPPVQEPTISTVSFSIDPDSKTANYQQWQLSIERELTSTTRIMIAYLGSKGTHLHRRVDINQGDPGPLPTPDPPNRPWPKYGSILASHYDANSNYNAMQLTFTKQFSNGFSFYSSYEHANGFDDASNEVETAQDRRNLASEYGRSYYLVPDRFRVTGVYDLPFGKGRRFLGGASGFLGKLVSGWQVNTIAVFQKGTPLTILTTSTHNSETFDFIGAFMRANQTCDGNLEGNQRTLEKYFNTSCFNNPPNGTFGNGKRGAILGPGLNNWDITIAKETRYSEKGTVRFQMQMFNAFNHAQFFPPGTNAGVPQTFGKIIGALNGRSIQFGLTVRF